MAAVMTVFNRKTETLRCLRSLSQQVLEGVELTVIVVDDASPDGTAQAIESQFPHVEMIRGTGDLYWNGGMRLGLGAAYAQGFDFYWWLNDDVELDPDALSRLLNTADSLMTRDEWPAIVVGSTRDSQDGHVTYGGRVRKDPRRPFRFSLVEPRHEPMQALTMNGNCVLVPREVADDMGNLAPAYRQQMGDHDYGLRANKAGYGIWVAPGTFGVCDVHPPRDTTKANLGEELSRLWSVKELPFGSWATFTRRWGGILWPLYFVSPYLRRGIWLVRERVRRL